MEVICRVVNQSALETQQWTNGNGEQKVLKKVNLHLVSGDDNFVAEATGDLAEAINEKPVCSDEFKGHLFKVRLRFSVSKSKEGNRLFMNCRLDNITVF